jgi:hypothetical protein
VTARGGQCAVCKAHYWLIDGVIVRHMPSKPVTRKVIEEADLCEGSEKPPLGSPEYPEGYDTEPQWVMQGGLPTLGKHR